MRLVALWGVYHARGGLVGEFAYVLGKLRGTAHCALCDITHSGVRPKAEWTALQDSLEAPIRLVHLNEQSPELAEAVAGRTPCIIAEYESAWHVLLGPEELDACGGSVARFRELLDAARERVEASPDS